MCVQIHARAVAGMLHRTCRMKSANPTTISIGRRLANSSNGAGSLQKIHELRVVGARSAWKKTLSKQPEPILFRFGNRPQDALIAFPFSRLGEELAGGLQVHL